MCVGRPEGGERRRRGLQKALITHYLGYAPDADKSSEASNHRNGVTAKTLRVLHILKGLAFTVGARH